MTPRLAVIALVALLAACGGSADAPPPEPGRPPGQTPPPAPAGPPSVILVSLDTVRADHLGCYGDAGAETPTVDSLATAGARFSGVFTPAPITLPAHTSLLTGLFPAHHGVHDNGLYRLPDDVGTLAEAFAAAGRPTAAVVGSSVLDRQYGLNRGFAVYDDRVADAGKFAITERDADRVTDAAIRALDRLRPPFFLFVHYFDAHAPYRPPASFDRRFADRPYDGEIAFADRALGRLRDELRRRGILGNAIVAVVADHGEGLGEHGEATHGVFLYQATVHVPWVLSGAGIPSGVVIDRPVSLVDVAPTLLELSGIELPAMLDGRSQAAFLEGRASDAPLDAADRFLPIETDLGFNTYGWSPLRALTDGRMKWIGAPRPELYDLAEDPDETTDLIDRKPDVARDLERRWAARYADARLAPSPGGGAAEAGERAAALSSLGYVAAGGRGRPSGRGLADPKDVVGSVAELDRARALLAAGRPDEAVDLLGGLVGRQPGNLSALILLGTALVQAGHPAKAVEPLREAARLAPGNADVQFNLGIALSSTGDVAGAEAAWRRALELSPRYLEAAANLIDLLAGTGRVDQAEGVLAEARRAGLDGPLLDYFEGRFALLRGDTDGARRALVRAINGPLPPGVAQDARSLLVRLGPS